MTRTSLVCAFLLLSRAAVAQVDLGIVGGIAFAGRQDVTIEQRSAPEGSVVSVTQEPDLTVAHGDAWGVTLTRWTRRHPSLGFNLDFLYWRNSLTLTGADPSGSRRTLHQERTGLFPSLAARLPLTAAGNGAALYGTFGIGAVDSHLIHGDQRLGVGFSMAAGLSVPLVRDKVLLHLEARYLITHDYDSDDSNDQNLEFSGSPSWTTARRVFGGHQDTRFLPVLLGLFVRF